MRLKRFYLIFMFFTLGIYAQEETVKDNLHFNAYGIFRAHIAIFGNEAEIQEASPRVGVIFNYHFGENNKYAVFFGGEFAINLIDNQFDFQSDPNDNNSGFTSLGFTDKKNTFSTRLGFIGVDFDKLGVLAIGKQNSVYMDAASVTDIFNVMSGQASYVFSPEGADGGDTGTGRADGALIYRNSLGKFDIGLQTQMRAGLGDNIFDHYGASLRYHISDHLTLGSAYNKALIGPRFAEIENLRGFEGDPTYFSASFVYNKGPLFLSGIFVDQENGDFVNTIDPIAEEEVSIVYPGKGYELVFSYLLMDKRLNLLAGFNYKKPEPNHDYLPDGFRKRIYLLGAQYRFIKYASVYSEFKYEDSINGLGLKPENVFLLGVKVDFDRSWKKNVDL